MIRSLCRLFTQAAPKAVTAAAPSATSLSPPAANEKLSDYNPLDPRHGRPKPKRIPYFPENVNNKLINTAFFKDNKDKFTKCPRKIWLIHQFLLKSPVTTKELWARYQQDKTAVEKGLFRSEISRFDALETRLRAPDAA